jgi:phospholipid transport system transporter-binding protein
VADQKVSASFKSDASDRSLVEGALHFSTVSALLLEGEQAIEAGHAAVIDLKGVTFSDSSGLALLIEWLSYAQYARRTLKYENIPKQIHELAHLSELEALLAGS